ncbi:Phospholipase D1 [Cyphellophora attinorum]|uniref:phospholipase D n=1 Tax=Cyphellophora attinorum TaxID=1664694 RepID=A0A0N0NKW3_9EURO|nr:Phospholipase D1 [Phialophora attinorum]KPI38498.1 Phospholipase D1 [Phialophora attinorum]
MSWQQGQGQDDPLAYGNDFSNSRGSGQGGKDRSFLGDTLNKFKTRYGQSGTQNDFGYTSGPPSQPSSSQHGRPTSSGGYYGYGQPTQGQGSQPAYPGGPPPAAPGQKQDFGDKLFGALHGTIHSIGSDIAGLMGDRPAEQPSQGQYQSQNQWQQSQSWQAGSVQGPQKNRYDSFASERSGNDVKWYVDGAGYFYAVSLALESARESIWILDWWLTPELYLRRPPSKNEQWRIDRTLQRAAQRGVKVSIIVYKEVTQALTLSSAHTKHALEALHPNIAVFRHPDHLPDAQTAQSSLVSAFQGLKLDAAGLAKVGADTLKGAYGLTDDVILYWAHHEKLLIVDGRLAFMGGLDLCFGRWDTNQHSISDVHPSDVNLTLFPGQDYNNARVMDFSDVAQPFQNKLDRTKSSRMGWSDLSISLHGQCVQDLRHHFIDRWNFIYDEKYNVRRDARYSRIGNAFPHTSTQPLPQSAQQQHQQGQPGQTSQLVGQQYNTLAWSAPMTTQDSATVSQTSGSNFPPPPGSQPYTAPAWSSTSQPSTSGVQSSSQWQEQGSAQPYGQSISTSRPHTPNAQSWQHPQSDPQAVYEAAGQAIPPPPPGPPPPGPNWETKPSYQPPQHADTWQSVGPQPPLSQTQTWQSTQSQPTAPQQYSAYHDSTQSGYTPTGQSQDPYQHSSYQAPAGSHTRGFDESQPYAGGERGLGYDQQYSTERGDSQGRERGMKGRFNEYRQQGKLLGQELTSLGNYVQGGLNTKMQHYENRIFASRGPMNCQLLRSCTKWSNGTATEHSIQNAYISLIEQSEHFVYIENQFFITATGDKQKSVKNLIGKALVDRILRAARNGQKYKVVVLMPAVPAFAGDLRDDDSLGTRAIMEFQYNSINRGGESILELIAKAGYNPMEYIRFYNLRNYDRINVSNSMARVEQQSGVSYEDARKQHDDMVGSGWYPSGEGTSARPGVPGYQYQQFQQAAPGSKLGDRWDSVAECYMLGGEDIRRVPWNGPPEAELDAFVSEELYIHTKCMIVDDRYVIVGSANLNDRSQLGTHDSEIALMVHDPTPVQSSMNGRSWMASRFAASLRRQLFRKHLGLIRPQDYERQSHNLEPVGTPNDYDWGTPEDNLVADPLSDTFLAMWNSRARTNTEVFRKAFRALPDDNVHTWSDYKEFYEYYFHGAEQKADGKATYRAPPKVAYGHVVREDFPGGVGELKELLSRVRGTLVEMPLTFLQGEDIAKEGLTLNALTEEVYT